jgi:hypothetical protein
VGKSIHRVSLFKANQTHYEPPFVVGGIDAVFQIRVIRQIRGSSALTPNQLIRRQRSTPEMNWKHHRSRLHSNRSHGSAVAFDHLAHHFPNSFVAFVSFCSIPGFQCNQESTEPTSVQFLLLSINSSFNRNPTPVSIAFRHERPRDITSFIEVRLGAPLRFR